MNRLLWWLAFAGAVVGVLVVATAATYFIAGQILWWVIFKPSDVAFEGQGEWRMTWLSVGIGLILGARLAVALLRRQGVLSSRGAKGAI